MTELMDFVKSQIATHGEDYVYDLMDRKYVPVLTSVGWRWLYVSDSEYLQIYRTITDQWVSITD